MNRFFSHSILIGSGVAAGYGVAKLAKTEKTGTILAFMGLGIILAYGLAIYFDIRAWNNAFKKAEEKAEKEVKS